MARKQALRKQIHKEDYGTKTKTSNKDRDWSKLIVISARYKGRGITYRVCKENLKDKIASLGSDYIKHYDPAKSKSKVK